MQKSARLMFGLFQRMEDATVEAAGGKGNPERKSPGLPPGLFLVLHKRESALLVPPASLALAALILSALSLLLAPALALRLLPLPVVARRLLPLVALGVVLVFAVLGHGRSPGGSAGACRRLKKTPGGVSHW
ncbi:MAG: hypothetical protein R3278_09865 [Lysobacter spongiicola]|nr:hypothetical protein [Lysobacter spongiicola]